MAQTFNEKIKSGIQAREQRKTDIYSLEESLPEFLSASKIVKRKIQEYKDIAEAKKAAEEAEARAKAEEQAKAVEAAKKRQEYAQAQAKQLYGATTTQPIVGGEMPMYKKGGVAKMVTINVEKGELAVDPRTMKVIMDFNDMPKHPKGKDVINQKGNVKVPVGTIIIPADMRKDFLKAKPEQRVEMAGELVEKQREGEEKEMPEGEEMPQGQGMQMQQGMGQGQGMGMMSMMGGEEGSEEMERMRDGGLVGAEKIIAKGDTAFGYKKADKNNKDVYKRWEDKTLLKYPKADKEALKEFYQKNVTPVLTKDNKIDFVENMVWYKKIHGTEDKIENYPNKINISQDMIERIKKDKNKSMSDSLNQESDYIKYGMGGYVKKYQNGTTGVYPTSGTAVDLTGSSTFDTGTLGGYSPLPYTAPAVEQYEMTQEVDTGYQPINIYQQPQAADKTQQPWGSKVGGGGGIGAGLGAMASAIPQYFLGKKQEREAKAALAELQKKEWAKYKPTSELEQQKRDVEAARKRAEYGFSPQELGARQQQVAQAQRTAYQRARESGLSGAGQAMLAALGSQRLQALNEMAIQDARLREQKAQYADSSQRSLAQQYQALANAQTAQDIRYRTMQEQAYGTALRTGVENQYGAYANFFGGMGQAVGGVADSALEKWVKKL